MRRFTPDEDIQLKRYWGTDGQKFLEEEFGRTALAIRNRAIYLGIEKKRTTLGRPKVKLADKQAKTVAPRNVQFTEKTPIELLKLMMEKHDLNQGELGKIMGLNKGNTSDVMHGKQKLTLGHIRALHVAFPELPLEQLIQSY